MKRNANSTLPAIAEGIVLPTANSIVVRSIFAFHDLVVDVHQLVLVLASHPAKQQSNEDGRCVDHKQDEDRKRNDEWKDVVDDKIEDDFLVGAHEAIISKAIASGNCNRSK